MYDPADLEINTTTYDWSLRTFSVLQRRLGLNIKFHRKDGQADTGQIFLFNHFARFETLIPPYLIHAETGAYCRSVATKDLFAGGEGFTRFLMGLGAVPNDLPGLLPFLAAEILRGRKVIVFPEGGMIKDRRTIDAEGEYGIYSRTAGRWRKHHAGAAVIALVLEVFKSRIISVHDAGNRPRLERWVDSLGMSSVETLLEAARKRTLIVPANITFYPIRVSDNILQRSIEFFVKGLKPQFSEEILIESNLLLNDTDMDVRFGTPIEPKRFDRWWEEMAIDAMFEGIDSLTELFSLHKEPGKWIERFVSTLLRRETNRLRDIYMREIYDEVTINLAHLASAIMLGYVDADRTEVSRAEFHRALYLAIKGVQREPDIHLHRILTNPEAYESTESGNSRGLDDFWASAVAAKLVDRQSNTYSFLPKLREEHAFDRVRIENPVLVYANEIAPLKGVNRAIETALRNAPTIDEKELARLRFDDELMRHAWCRENYRQERHASINEAESATQSGAPFLLFPDRDNGSGTGIVLIHGFLASPAELRELGDRMSAAGYPVIGIRLEGHGTSPWDLHDRSWEDWFESVQRGFRIMSAFVDKVCLVGFSTGGSLAIQLAADHPENLAGVATVSAPVKFRNRNLILVPLIHHANTIASWVSNLDGVMPFRPNDSEHPDINYRHIPIRGLHELQQTVDGLMGALPRVKAPTFVVHATEDPVIDPESAKIIMDGLQCERKELCMIEAERHGILYENIGDCQDMVIRFIDSLWSDIPARATT